MAALARLRKSFGGGVLGATTLAPTLTAPVPGQFDDAPSSRAGTEVTTYDEFGRPRLAGSGEGGGSNGAKGGSAEDGRGNGAGDDGDDHGVDRDSRDRDR